MKNVTKKLVVGIMLLSMIMSLTACGTKSEGIVGTWVGPVDMTELLNAEMEALGEGVGEYFTFNDCSINIIVEYKEDGTQSVTIDKDSMSDFVDKFKDVFASGMGEYMETVLADSGMDMSFDDFLASQGTTIEEFVDEYCNEDMFSQYVTESEGKYKLEGDKLYEAEEDGTFSEDYILIDLSGDQMVWKEAVYASDSSEANVYEAMLPITFERKK